MHLNIKMFGIDYDYYDYHYLNYVYVYVYVYLTMIIHFKVPIDARGMPWRGTQPHSQCDEKEIQNKIHTFRIEIEILIAKREFNSQLHGARS